MRRRGRHTRKFAFLSTAVSGELQLGGYDREERMCDFCVCSSGGSGASTNADMVYVPTTSTTEYSVNVQSLTSVPLLDCLLGCADVLGLQVRRH
eukprot:746875-Hanusia_phi.AAC.3